MNIKILNKNDNAIFKVVDGAVFRDNYNETLDSATIKVTHLNHKIDIEPFDIVYLSDIKFLDNKYMVVDKYTCRQINYAEPIFYEYDIDLISETKQLENIILPSLKITQNKNGGYKRTIYEYIEQYLDEYCVKIKTPSVKGVSYDNKFDIGATISDMFFEVECPEMQWNNPTLREVLTDLMMVKDCIPVVINGVIECLNISKTQNLSGNENTINYMQESQSSDDYVSDLRMDLKNVMQTERNGIDNTTDVVDYITPRSNNFILTTDNMEIHTQNPILRIKHLYMGFLSDRKPKIEGGQSAGLRYYYEQDLMNCKDDGDNTIYHCVYEEQEAQSLPLWFNDYDGYLNFWKTMATHQNFVLSYARGSNVIHGLSKETTLMHFLGFNKLAIQYLTKCKQEHIPLIDGDTQMDDGYKIQNNLWDIFFKIEYETTADSVCRVGKYLPSTNYREIIDNQTNSYVDPYAQGLLEYSKINRLGNKMSLINARAFNKNDIYNMGSVYNDKIVFKRDIQCFKDYAIVNYWATPNYVLRNYFTGVKSKIRSWQLLSGNEALIRHDLIKMYVEFSYNRKNEPDIDYTIKGVSSIPSLFFNGDTKLKGCFVSPIYDGGDNTNYYAMNFTSKVVGRSILLTWGMNDNYNIGKHITYNVEGGLAQANYVYADKNGNNNGFFVTYVTNYNILNKFNMVYPYDGKKLESAGNVLSKGVKTMASISHDLPLVSLNTFDSSIRKIDYTIFRHKDNAEITRVTTQVEFCSDTPNIVITNEFVDRQVIISDLDTSEKVTLNNIKVYLSDKVIDITNPNKNVLIDNNDVLFENVLKTEDLGKNCLRLYIDLTLEQQELWFENVNANKKHMILAIKNKPILFVKDFGLSIRDIYVNLLKTRDNNVYNIENVYEKVGTIVI